MKNKFMAIWLVAIFSCIGVSANDGIDKQTFIYSIKGTDTLRLDKYDLPS